MLEHRTPFDSPEGRSGRNALAIERAGIRITSVRDRGLLLLQSASAACMQEALMQAVGLTLPPIQTAAVLGQYALLWLTPAEWLLELPARETDPMDHSLTQRLSSSLSVVTDLSDALVSIDFGGAGAAALLMTGCSLDLRPHSFPSGRVARTALADVPAILWNRCNTDGLRCLVDRAFAPHLTRWLEGATPP